MTVGRIHVLTSHRTFRATTKTNRAHLVIFRGNWVRLLFNGVKRGERALGQVSGCKAPGKNQMLVCLFCVLISTPARLRQSLPDELAFAGDTVAVTVFSFVCLVNRGTNFRGVFGFTALVFNLCRFGNPTWINLVHGGAVGILFCSWQS